MLAAYYGRVSATQSLFQGLQIASDPGFLTHLNQYDVIKLDMQDFMTNTSSMHEMLSELSKDLIFELLSCYPDIPMRTQDNLPKVCASIFHVTGRQFVFLIDEWDCVMRRAHSEEDKTLYLDYLRNLLKGKSYVALAYMTGILPIKKYGEHSTLNMFTEYTMTDSAEINDCFGFTEEEVQGLCAQYGMEFGGAKEWYDGYHLYSYARGEKKEYSMYTPKSIVEAMLNCRYDSYWSKTETFTALRDPIEMNFDGLKDAVIRMLGGEPVPVTTRSFQNDMQNLHNRDDVLTMLVHLGYLSYDQEQKTVSIPNKEVSEEFITSIDNSQAYVTVAQSVKASQKLLEAIWSLDGATVAAGVDKAHQEISILQYNDENSLACCIGLAFYYAREYYTMIRECPAGKGFADIVCIPRPRYADRPALVLELKWDKSVQAAIAQIKARSYPAALQDYQGNLLLVGINYDRASKTHSCVIEKWVSE